MPPSLDIYNFALELIKREKKAATQQFCFLADGSFLRFNAWVPICKQSVHYFLSCVLCVKKSLTWQFAEYRLRTSEILKGRTKWPLILNSFATFRTSNGAGDASNLGLCALHNGEIN